MTTTSGIIPATTDTLRMALELRVLQLGLIAQLTAIGDCQHSHIRKAFNLASDNKIADARQELMTGVQHYTNGMIAAEQLAKRIHALEQQCADLVEEQVTEHQVEAGECSAIARDFLKGL